MQGPSAAILINDVDIYPALSGPDGEGGPQFQYAQTPQVSSVPCSVQYRRTEEIVETSEEGQERVSIRNVYRIIFDDYQNYMPRSKVVQTDITPNRVLYLQSSPPSEAGRGSTFVMRALEYL